MDYSVVLLNWESSEVSVWREWCDQVTVSPFQTPTYLQYFAEHFVDSKQVVLLCVKQGDEILAFGAFVVSNHKATALGMQFVDGNQEISDYFDIVYRPSSTVEVLQQVWRSLFQWFKSAGVTQLQLDYVPAFSQTYQTLMNLSSLVTISEPLMQEVAPKVALPSDWTTYVGSLKKKHRDELKRKLKRIDLIKPVFEFTVEATDEMNAEFIRLHRLSDNAKQSFMTDSMARFFKTIATQKYEGGWQWRYAFASIAGVRVAAVAYFQRDADALLLYNSGYDPTYRQYGVGFSLVSRLLQHAIEHHIPHFDFLRGSERYKYELGGVDQQLYQIQITP